MQPVHKTSITSSAEFKGIISGNKCSGVLAWTQPGLNGAVKGHFLLLSLVLFGKISEHLHATGLFPYFSPNPTQFYNSMV